MEKIAYRWFKDHIEKESKEEPMKLSEHFSFEELTDTTEAALQAANRTEAGIYLANLTDLAIFILEPLRAKYGPITISSGFRGPTLNAKVHGEKTSLHCSGKAADCVRPEWTWEKLDEVCLWIAKESGLKWGEVVREKRTKSGATWLHITSPAPGNNMELWDGIDNKYTLRRKV